MERKLLLLGLLRSQNMHGYQLNEFINNHLGTAVHLTKPTAYRLLNRMADEGWITCSEEREGNRPPRRVFAITPEGETAFQQLLRESLADFKPIAYPGHISLLFLDAIPPKEAVELLLKRRSSVESALRVAHAHKVHGQSFLLTLVHQIRHLTTELEWIDQVISQLTSKASRPQNH